MMGIEFMQWELHHSHVGNRYNAMEFQCTHDGNKDSHNGIISIPIMGIAYTHDGNLKLSHDGNCSTFPIMGISDGNSSIPFIIPITGIMKIFLCYHYTMTVHFTLPFDQI